MNDHIPEFPVVPDQPDNPEPGKLKIFFGYATGVGKTSAMLEAARRIRETGVDVVAGFINTHGRPEMEALLESLEVIPPKLIHCRETVVQEFDLDAALKRRPEIILVDEMAHMNTEGARHRRRYQDIEELLHAGIHVYTTVNVQQLESLNDIVASITGAPVSERVPDKLFDAAQQVEVVDIEPEELIERIHSGKISGQAWAQDVQPDFYTKENLAALREIALRRSADRLNKSSYKTGNTVRAKVNEHILICLSASPSNPKVIRTAARMAEAFHGRFTALLVENRNTKVLRGENLRRLRMNIKLAEQLGAKIATVYGEDAAFQIVEYAKASGVSKVVLGHSNHRVFAFFQRRNMVERLTQMAPELDIYIIPDRQPLYRRKDFLFNEPITFSFLDLLKSLAVIAASSVIGMAFFKAGFKDANIITVYILGILVTAIWTSGRIYSALASFLSVIIFNFLFTEPRYTLFAYDASYPVTFLTMLVAGVLTSSLAMRIKEQAKQAARKAYRTEVLLETSQMLQKAENETEILNFTGQQLHKLLERPVFFYQFREGRKTGDITYFPADSTEAEYLPPKEKAVANWVYKNNNHAGATTDTFPGAKNLYLAVRGKTGVLAVAGIAVEGYGGLDAFEKNLLLAILDESGMALDKERFSREKQQAELVAKQESLRANLLRAISHDLRTPLTSISGNAGVLMENEDILDTGKRHELYENIYDDSLWLMALVENLLSVTRLENGTMELKMGPELIDEVFHEAMQHLDRRADRHHIETRLEDDLMMARMDVQLLIQVIVNIINNAIKYTQEGSHILVSARERDKQVEISIADDGPGIGDEAKLHIFDMFYTADNVRGDGRRGLGLGLSLCKSIISAHGGKIWVEDNLPQGTVFRFTLNAVEVNSGE